jgi:hypothetical protein
MILCESTFGSISKRFAISFIDGSLVSMASICLKTSNIFSSASFRPVEEPFGGEYFSALLYESVGLLAT